MCEDYDLVLNKIYYIKKKSCIINIKKIKDINIIIFILKNLLIDLNNTEIIISLDRNICHLPPHNN